MIEPLSPWTLILLPTMWELEGFLEEVTSKPNLTARVGAGGGRGAWGGQAR